MTTGTNGGSVKLRDWRPTTSWRDNGAPSDVTRDQAFTIIDDVIASHGLNAARSTDADGWRHIAAGPVDITVGLVQGGTDEVYLAVLAPVLEVPSDPKALACFYKILLELNHERTLGTRFSIRDDVIHVVLTRPIAGLDAGGVREAIRSVLRVVDSYDDRLLRLKALSLALEPVSLAELPDIKMTPREAGVIRSVLSGCDPHGREILRYILEGWQNAGHIVVVDPDTTRVGLKIELGSGPRLTLYTLAAVRPSLGSRRRLLILGWEGLREGDVFPPEAIDAFQASVTEIAGLQPVENTAYIEVTEAFGLPQARALLWALRHLAQNACVPEQEPYIWDPSLPAVNARLGQKTLAGIQAALLACEPRVRLMFVRLIEGWSKTGGTVHCYRPGRIYLRLRTREGTHIFNLAVLTAPRGKRGPSIHVAWDLADGPDAYLADAPGAVARFRAAVSTLPGLGRRTCTAHLRIDAAFQMPHVEQLLQAMRDLKASTT
jgi:hypothetical protein